MQKNVSFRKWYSSQKGENIKSWTNTQHYPLRGQLNYIRYLHKPVQKILNGSQENCQTKTKTRTLIKNTINNINNNLREAIIWPRKPQLQAYHSKSRWYWSWLRFGTRWCGWHWFGWFSVRDGAYYWSRIEKSNRRSIQTKGLVKEW